MRSIGFSLCMLLLTASLAPAADEKAASVQEVEKLTAQAVVAYKAGKADDAITALQKAITLIQKQAIKGLESFLPKVSDNWTPGKIESNSGSWQDPRGGNWQWTSAQREYTQGSDDDTTTVEVALNSSPMVTSAMQSMIQSYRQNREIINMMAQAGTKITILETNGWQGYRMVQQDGEAMALLVKGRLMLSIKVDKPDTAALDTFYNAIDLKALGETPAAKAEPVKDE